ncbi:MAG: MarR family transcriptional regulator [Acidimicrobiia bacterium]|jgi:DNA-binding MarR family transcriptional regulator|nr:MarR family transcriptional regulator [Acidimicrobiia bacterium]
MSGGPWLDEGEQAAWRGAVRMHTHLTSQLGRRLAVESTLSYPDYEVLVALTDLPDGRLRLFELAQELGWEQSRLSHHVARMAARDLVTKEPCEEDRRGFLLAVTDEGRAAIAVAAPGHVMAVRELFIDRLTTAQLDAITEVAAAVLAASDAEPLPPGPTVAGRQPRELA